MSILGAHFWEIPVADSAPEAMNGEKTKTNMSLNPHIT